MTDKSVKKGNGRESVSARRMKRLLDLIQTHPQRFSELVDAAKEFDGGAAMKHNAQVDRLLKDLEYLDLIRKDEDGVYVSRYNVQTYDTYGQYRFLIDHSEKLLEGRDQITSELDGWRQERTERFMKYATRVRKKKVTEKGFLAKMFIKHLRTGYPETFDKLDAWGKGLKETQGLTHSIIITMEKVLPDSEEYLNMKIERLSKKDGFRVAGKDSYGNRVLIVSVIMDELANLLRYNPSLTKIPYKNEYLGLQIGFAKLDMSRSLVQEVIEVLPQFEAVFDDIKRLNAYEVSVEKLRGDIINALTSIAASVWGGKPLKGVCSGCRDIVIEGKF